ncbi:MAG: hypothetical protein QNJ20_04925 [Paracoccaceae bacterium]|nr:hypothetical protein [Paracoccaceae bacterium]
MLLQGLAKLDISTGDPNNAVTFGIVSQPSRLRKINNDRRSKMVAMVADKYLYQNSIDREEQTLGTRKLCLPSGFRDNVSVARVDQF